MTSAIEMKLVMLLEMKTLIGRIRPFTPKNQEKPLSNSSDGQENDANFLDGNSSNEKDAQHSPKRGMILSFPNYRKMRIEMKI